MLKNSASRQKKNPKKKEEHRGGARVGAGRPKVNRPEVVYLRLSTEALQWLDSRTYSRSEYIDNMLLTEKKERDR